jgi:hypothetical protein
VKGSCYTQAVEAARADFSHGAPVVMSAAAGAPYRPAGEGGVFHLPLLNTPLEITFPDGVVLAAGEEAGVDVTIVVLHYLARSSGPLDLLDPVRYSSLHDAAPYGAAFHTHTEAPLAQRFGRDGEAFARALTSLGGHPYGSDPAALWQVQFLPHLPLGVRLGLEEEGFPADCVLLFPRRAGFVYHVEDLAVAGELLADRLLRADGGAGVHE